MDSSSSDSRSDYEIRQFKFDELPEYSEIVNSKPKLFKTPLDEYEVNSWRKVYRLFCVYVMRVKPRHLKAFKNLEETFLGRRVMFSNSDKELIEPFKLSHNFFAEQNLSAKSIVHNIIHIIQFCRLSPRQFAVQIPVRSSATASPEQSSQNAGTSLIKRFSLDEIIPSLRFSKPFSLTIGRRKFSISKWRDVVVETAKYILENDPDSFRILYRDYGPQGYNRTLFSKDYTKVHTAVPISSKIYVEINFGATDCVKKAILFLSYTDIELSRVKLEYIPTNAREEAYNTLLVEAPVAAVDSDDEPTDDNLNNDDSELDDDMLDSAEEVQPFSPDDDDDDDIDVDLDDDSDVDESDLDDDSDSDEDADIDEDDDADSADEDIDEDIDEDSEDEDADEDDSSDNAAAESGSSDVASDSGFQPQNAMDEQTPSVPAAVPQLSLLQTNEFLNAIDSAIVNAHLFELKGLSPELQRLVDVIEDKFSDGIDLDNESSINLLEKASGIQCTEELVDDLRAILFERCNGTYLLPGRIADESTALEMCAYISENMTKYGVLALSKVRDKFQYRLRFVTSENQDLANYVYLCYNRIADKDRRIQVFYYDSDSKDLSICLPEDTTEKQFHVDLSLQIKQYMQPLSDAASIFDICDQFPYLNQDVITFNLAEYVDDVFPVEIDDQTYWRTFESLNLEDDFSDVLTKAVTEIENQGEVPTIKSIAAKLDEAYPQLLTNGESAFRDTFGLDDDKVFKAVVKKYYTGQNTHKWKYARFVAEESNNTVNHYDEFKKQYPDRGVFHESLFMDFAKRKIGSENASSLISTHLRPNCIRIDIEHWIDKNTFIAQSNFSQEISSSIVNKLKERLGSQPFLQLGLLSETFMEELPELKLNGKALAWNEYLLTSICVLLINELTVINDEPNSYQVTAILLPDNTPVPNDVVEFAIECYLNKYKENASIDGALEYLKLNRIRCKRTKYLEEQITTLMKNR